jgi:hypothetical protein
MVLRIRGALPLLAAALVWAESPAASAKAALPLPAKSAKPALGPESPAKARPASPSAQAPDPGTLQATAPAQPAPLPVLADAFIAQNALRVYLNRSASVTVYNSRGQQIFHRDSQRSLETVPLQGMSTGFLYLTVRGGLVETTKKLVYTGK